MAHDDDETIRASSVSNECLARAVKRLAPYPCARATALPDSRQLCRGLMKRQRLVEAAMKTPCPLPNPEC